MSDWATESATQMLARNSRSLGAGAVMVGDAATLQAEIATALRIAKNMGRMEILLEQKSKAEQTA